MSEGWLTNEHPAWQHAWQPVGTLDELAGAGGLLPVRLGGATFVVLDTPTGPISFADRCRDGLAPLSIGQWDGSVLRCRAGGTHDPADPAGSGLVALPVEVRYGLLWLAPGGSVCGLPEVPEWDDTTFSAVPIPVQEWNASAAQMADNFLDVAHFPFTHSGSIGDPDDRLVAPYDVVRDGWRFEVRHRHATKTLAESLDPGENFATEMRSLTFVATPPHHVYLQIRYEDTGTVFALCFFHQAVDDERTRLFALQLRNDILTGQSSPEEALAFQLKVANEDKWLLEQFEVKGIPVDPSEEFHVRADRITLELRRMLTDLVAEVAA